MRSTTANTSFSHVSSSNISSNGAMNSRTSSPVQYGLFRRETRSPLIRANQALVSTILVSLYCFRHLISRQRIPPTSSCTTFRLILVGDDIESNWLSWYTYNCLSTSILRPRLFISLHQNESDRRECEDESSSKRIRGACCCTASGLNESSWRLMITIHPPRCNVGPSSNGMTSRQKGVPTRKLLNSRWAKLTSGVCKRLTL